MYLRKCVTVATAIVALAASTSAQEPARASGPSVDAVTLEIANVRLGMTADQAIAGLRQTFGQSVKDWKVADQGLTESIRLKRDMNYGVDVIFYAVAFPAGSTSGSYIDHIFYNIETAHEGRESLIINLAKAPGQEAGPARVFQVLKINRGASRGTIIDEVSQRAIADYGTPTYAASAVAEIWCAGVANQQCAPDKPYLALVPIRQSNQHVRSMMQLYDPSYGKAEARTPS